MSFQVGARERCPCDRQSPVKLPRDDTRAQPKGTIRWAEYASRHVPRGDLHHVPCRYPDLGIDPEIVRAVRWTLERLHSVAAITKQSLTTVRIVSPNLKHSDNRVCSR